MRTTVTVVCCLFTQAGGQQAGLSQPSKNAAANLKFIIACSNARSIWDKWNEHPFVPHSESFKEFAQKHGLTPIDPLPPSETGTRRTLPEPDTQSAGNAKKVCDKLDPNMVIETMKITSAKVQDVKVTPGSGIKKDSLVLSLRTDMPYSALVSKSAEC